MALSSILGVWLHEESLGGVGEGGGEVGSGGKENRLVVFSQEKEDTFEQSGALVIRDQV